MKKVLIVALMTLTPAAAWAQSPDPLPTINEYSCDCTDATGESSSLGSVQIQVDGHSSESDIEASGDRACKQKYGADSLNEVKVKTGTCSQSLVDEE
ncbi:MAG: hypothetical protein JNL01_07855 [Bdellovibrionales bacterium]|nr:hypothetical protein [Bdellovibrionales bacterium]